MSVIEDLERGRALQEAQGFHWEKWGPVGPCCPGSALTRAQGHSGFSACDRTNAGDILRDAFNRKRLWFQKPYTAPTVNWASFRFRKKSLSFILSIWDDAIEQAKKQEPQLLVPAEWSTELPSNTVQEPINV